MDAATLGAVGTIVAGLAVAGAAFYGHRGTARTSTTGAVINGYGGLVDQLQEERADLRQRLAEAEGKLAEAYAELAGERADKAGLQRAISRLEGQCATLRQRIIDEGGVP